MNGAEARDLNIGTVRQAEILPPQVVDAWIEV